MEKFFLQSITLFLLFIGFSGNTLAQSVTVNNAGTTAVNGNYTYSTTYNSKPYFNKDDGTYRAIYCVYIGSGPRWQISNPSGYAYYINTSDTPLPPQDGWIICPSDDIIAAPGLAPVPTLSGDVSLPVELTSFTGIVKGKAVELAWQTATEVNNHGFEIERSPSPTPSQREGTSQVPPSGGFRGAWEVIGFVEGAGNSNIQKSYSFVDAQASGKVLYRLKQIDNDGQFEYHGAVEVNASTAATFALMQNYPNPFNPATQINYALPASGFVSLKVYDMLGKEIATLVNGMQEAGEQQATFTASNYPSGMYFYTLRIRQTEGGQAGNYVETKKMLLVK